MFQTVEKLCNRAGGAVATECWLKGHLNYRLTIAYLTTHRQQNDALLVYNLTVICLLIMLFSYSRLSER